MKRDAIILTLLLSTGSSQATSSVTLCASRVAFTASTSDEWAKAYFELIYQPEMGLVEIESLYESESGYDFLVSTAVGAQIQSALHAFRDAGPDLSFSSRRDILERRIAALKKEVGRQSRAKARMQRPLYQEVSLPEPRAMTELSEDGSLVLTTITNRAQIGRRATGIQLFDALARPQTSLGSYLLPEGHADTPLVYLGSSLEHFVVLDENLGLFSRSIATGETLIHYDDLKRNFWTKETRNLSHDGRFFARVNFNKQIEIYDMVHKSAPTIIANPDRGSSRPTHLFFSPSGKRVAVEMSERQVITFEIASGQPLCDIDVASNTRLLGLISDDVWIGMEPEIRIGFYGIDNKRFAQIPKTELSLNAATVHQERNLVIGLFQGTMNFYDPKDGSLVDTYEIGRATSDYHFSGDGSILLLYDQPTAKHRLFSIDAILDRPL